MAKRTFKPHHSAEIRDKIRVSQLLNFLQNHSIKGTGSKAAGSRVRAALGLLAKVLPDLSATQLSNDPLNPLPAMGGVNIYLPDNQRQAIDVTPKIVDEVKVALSPPSNVVQLKKEKQI
jgi:hypothetical protein